MSEKIKKVDDGEYEYKGYTIIRKNSVPSGYWGRWQIGIGSRGPCFETRAQAILHIDTEVEKLAKG